MSNVITFPTSELRGHRAIEAALHDQGPIAASSLELLMRLASGADPALRHPTLQKRAARWLSDAGVRVQDESGRLVWDPAIDDGEALDRHIDDLLGIAP